MRSIVRFLAPLLLTASSLWAEDGIVFDQRYRSGHRYHQTVTTDQEMKMDLGGQKMEQTMSMKLGIGATVEDLPEGDGQRVTIIYDQAAMRQVVNGQEYQFDSQAPEASKAGPLAALAGILNREFRVIFNRQGEVKEVENFEATMEKLSAGNPATAKMYAQLFSKETVKQLIQQSNLQAPAGKRIKPGEAWPFAHDLALPEVGKLTVRGFYTFKGMKEVEGRQLAEVDAKAEIRVDVSVEEREKTATLMTQMKMKIEEGLMEGTLLYDPAIAFTRDVQLKQVVTLTAEIPDGTRRTLRLPMKQTIHLTLDQFEPVKAGQ